MRNLFHWRTLLVLLLGLGSVLAAHATHTRGGEISYAAIAPTTPGVPRYHVLMTLYADPRNNLSQEMDLVATRGACDSNDGLRVRLPRTILPSTSSSTCPTDPYYQLYTYETDLDLPAGRWTLSMTGENRPAGVVNIQNGNSINSNLYLYAFLDNTLTSQDTSPKFESHLLPFQEQQATTPLSFTAFDADGDSLSYAYALPQYNSEQQPFSSSLNNCGTPVTSSVADPHYTLNAATGYLSPIASATLPNQGFYSVVVRASEYRRLNGQWQLLGMVMRELIYQSYANPANTPPAFTTLSANGTAQPLTRPVVARAGQLLTLDLAATDADAGQHIRFTSNAPSVVPGLALSAPAAGQARLAWQVPATLPPGRYNLALDVLDDNCPLNASSSLTLTVVVAATAQPLAARPALNAEHEVYPVPFREQVQFRVAPGQAVTLLDALGRPVAQLRSGPDGRVQWQPGPGVAPGLYVARTADGQPVARLLRE